MFDKFIYNMPNYTFIYFYYTNLKPLLKYAS